MPSTHTTLEHLCNALDSELERQELLYGLVRAQHDAIRVHDHKTLEARTEAIGVLARDSRHAETKRHTLFDQLAIAYVLPVESRNMSGLIAASPAPFNKRLKELQTSLRTIVEKTQEQVRLNARLVQRSLRTVQVTLAAAQPPEQAAGYPMPRTGYGKSAPVLLDQRG